MQRTIAAHQEHCKVAVSRPLMRDTANAAEPITFEVSPWARTRIACGTEHTPCASASADLFVAAVMLRASSGVGTRNTGDWIAEDQDSRASDSGI